MGDLPDYQAWVEAIYLLAASLEHGADANKSADPDDGDVYLATDTEKLYVCYVDGVWTDITPAYLLLAGGTMTGNIAMGSNKVTGLGAPSAQNDALRYGQAEIRNAEIAAAAAIAYSKLNLADSILNADINSAAAIVYSKLSLAASLLVSDIDSAEFNVANKLVKLDASADVPDAQIPNLNASKITAGTLANARLESAIPKGEGARAYNDANLSIPNEEWTALAFNSERYDTDSIHDNTTNNSRLTCVTAGKYLIIVHFRFVSNATGGRWGHIYLNATTMITENHKVASSQDRTRLILATIYDLAVDDYVETRVYQNSGGALNVEASGNTSPEFMMQRIG